MAERIKRLLIANRGEIACRVIRTCTRLGIETVAVYSDPDALSLHTQLATTAVAIGGSETAESYLRGDRIIAAALESGADAIHPGYGFLSENAGFARAVMKAGLIFVGPSADAMDRLGDKLAAKKLAQKVKAPLAPALTLSGSKSQRQKEAIQFCRAVGYPVMVKASAGGGGRGMREVRAQGELAPALDSAAQEAARLFGNGTVFLEKIIRPARHLEVQIAADTKGNVVVLGDRDCTWQRNNQKLLEEAPAPGLTAKVRRSLHSAAIALAKAAQYSNVGTVEFLYDGRNKLFFMEVNSRLQVEHTVTEMVTGIDLVELQINLAQGKTLKELKLQRTPKSAGHAIQARLCAERLINGKVVTSTGRVARFVLPTDRRDRNGMTRVDSGFRQGDQITHYYDSLLAKVIAAGADRQKATNRLIADLQTIEIEGVDHNAPLLLRLAGDARFLERRHTITLLNEDPALSARDQNTAEAFAAAVFVVEDRNRVAALLPAGLQHQNRWYRVGDQNFSCSRGTVPDECVSFVRADGSFQVEIKKRSFIVQPIATGRWNVFSQGTTIVVVAGMGRPASENSTKTAHIGSVRSPLPGKILRLDVKKGSGVTGGDTVLILESMKMEHPVRAPSAGVIQAVHVKIGQTVGTDDLLIEIR